MYSVIKGIGEVYIPRKFESCLQERTVKYFSDRDLKDFSSIFAHLKNRGVALLKGEWETVLSVYQKCEQRKKELIDPLLLAHAGYHRKNKAFRIAENSIMLLAAGNQLRLAPPVEEIPFLLNLCGAEEDEKKEILYLLPLAYYLKIKAALAQRIPVKAVAGELFAHPQVLPPRSPQTNNLLLRVLSGIRQTIGDAAVCLDLGCGSGIITLLLASLFRNPVIYATDCLVEALGTTRINVAHFQAAGRPGLARVHVMSAGDLFDPLPRGLRFDLIAFNAPWINARIKSAPEQAINDQGFRTLGRFLEGCLPRLRPGGRIALCYSNHAGPRAITALEKLIAENRFVIKNLYKDKMKTIKKKWQTIYAYELACQPPER